jgi:hypothetical protein
MAKKFFESYVLFFAAVLAAVFTSCVDETSHTEDLVQTREAKEQFDRVNVRIDTINVPIKEVVTITHDGYTGSLSLEIVQAIKENPKYITEDQKVLTGNLVGSGTGGLNPTYKWEMNDGNVLDISTTGEMREVGGSTYSVRVKNATVVKWWNEAKAVQGSEEKERMKTFATVKYTTEVTSGNAHLNDTTFYKTTSWERIILKDEVVKVGDEMVNSGFEVKSGHMVDWWVITRPVYSDGSKGTEVRHTYTTQYGFETISLGTHTVSNFNFSVSRTNGIVAGSETEERTEGEWTIFGRSQNYSAVLSNGAKDINTSYVLNERRVRFAMGDIVVDFDYPDYVVVENATNVTEGAPSKTGFSGRVLANSVNTVYGGKSEGLNETGYLYKAVTRVVTFLDETARITTTPTTTTAEVTVVITEDGVEVRRYVEKISVPRSREVLTNWQAYEANASQSTGQSTFKTNKSNKSKDNWTYVEETYVYENNATLNASTQRNAVRCIEGNDFRVTVEGKTYTFAHIAPSMTNNAGSVAKGSETSEATVYNYTCGWNYSFNGSADALTTPGTITVKAVVPDTPFNGDLKGVFKSAAVTATLAQGSISDWGYGLTIQTTAGSYAFYIPKDKSSVVTGAFWLNDFFGYNSAFWYNNQLVPCVARDTDKALRWENKEGQNYRSISYSSAQTFHFNNNHNTVATDEIKVVTTDKGNHREIKIMTKGGQVLKTLTDSSK